MNHDIRVDITSARLNTLYITLPKEEGKFPEVTAVIGLFTPEGVQVSTFSVQTDAWDKKLKFDLPVTALPSIASLRDLIGEVVTQKCAQQFRRLPEAMAVEPEATS